MAPRITGKYIAVTLGACFILGVSTALAIAWGVAVAHVITETVGVSATSAQVNETRLGERPYEMDRLHAELVAAIPGTATEVGGQVGVATVVAPARERSQPITTNFRRGGFTPHDQPDDAASDELPRFGQ